MFEKLFLIVKRTASPILNSDEALRGQEEFVSIEASSALIETLKEHLEKGKLDELVRYFSEEIAESSSVTKNAVRRFASKLREHYSVKFEESLSIASAIVVDSMRAISKRMISDEDEDFTLESVLTVISGQRKEMINLVARTIKGRIVQPI